MSRWPCGASAIPIARPSGGSPPSRWARRWLIRPACAGLCGSRLCEAGGGAQFPRLRLLRTGALDRSPVGNLGPIRSARVPLEEQIADHPMHFRFPYGVAAPALEVHDRGLERPQGFIGIPLFFKAFRK